MSTRNLLKFQISVTTQKKKIEYLHGMVLLHFYSKNLGVRFVVCPVNKNKVLNPIKLYMKTLSVYSSLIYKQIKMKTYFKTISFAVTCMHISTDNNDTCYLFHIRPQNNEMHGDIKQSFADKNGIGKIKRQSFN